MLPLSVLITSMVWQHYILKSWRIQFSRTSTSYSHTSSLIWLMVLPREDGSTAVILASPSLFQRPSATMMTGSRIWGWSKRSLLVREIRDSSLNSWPSRMNARNSCSITLRRLRVLIFALMLCTMLWSRESMNTNVSLWTSFMLSIDIMISWGLQNSKEIRNLSQELSLLEVRQPQVTRMPRVSSSWLMQLVR